MPLSVYEPTKSAFCCLSLTLTRCPGGVPLIALGTGTGVGAGGVPTHLGESTETGLLALIDVTLTESTGPTRPTNTANCVVTAQRMMGTVT